MVTRSGKTARSDYYAIRWLLTGLRFSNAVDVGGGYGRLTGFDTDQVAARILATSRSNIG